MAGSSEARPKVIKIPILIEAAAVVNNNAAADENTSCRNWPAGGQLPAAEAASRSSQAAADVSGRKEAAVVNLASSASRIIPIRLADGRCAESASMSVRGAAEDVIVPGSSAEGLRPGYSGPKEIGSGGGGAGGLKARLAGGRANSVEERPQVAARGSPAAWTNGETVDNLVRTTSTSASDIR